MKISELIALLEKHKHDLGDVEVVLDITDSEGNSFTETPLICVVEVGGEQKVGIL